MKTVTVKSESGDAVAFKVKTSAAYPFIHLSRAASAFMLKQQSHMRKLLPLQNYVAECGGEKLAFSFGRTDRGEYVQRVAL